MAKKKELFFCKECGYESTGWLGKCPGCGEWNTFVAAPQQAEKSAAKTKGHMAWLGESKQSDSIINLADIRGEDKERLASGNPELDRVLGGGFVRGSLVLLGGDPGVGKSTLLIQVLADLTDTCNCLYISGEESAAQIRLRADRLQLPARKIKLLTTTDFSQIARTLTELKPDFVVIDSIQTIYLPDLSAAPGSVSQVREATAGLLKLAKDLNVTIVLVGHVTKEGAIAGPRILEHMVDTVLYFEGEGIRQYRIIRAVKNRFGTTDEVGLLEMTGHGLLAVEDNFNALLSSRPMNVSGSVITSSLEGSRVILLEIQSLLVATNYAQPLRMTQGLDRMRLSMLLAILAKVTKQTINNYDCYLNVTGGLKIKEPAADLAIVAAVASSLLDLPIKQDCIILGELGLAGELRSIISPEKRVTDAVRLGWRKFILPSQNKKDLAGLDLPDDCDIFYASLLTDALDILFK